MPQRKQYEISIKTVNGDEYTFITDESVASMTEKIGTGQGVIGFDDAEENFTWVAARHVVSLILHGIAQ